MDTPSTGGRNVKRKGLPDEENNTFNERPSVLPNSPPYRSYAMSAAGRGLTKAPNLTPKLNECFAWLATLPFSALAAAGDMGSGRCATRAHVSPHGFSRGDRVFCLIRYPTDRMLCPPPDADLNKAPNLISRGIKCWPRVGPGGPGGGPGAGLGFERSYAVHTLVLTLKFLKCSYVLTPLSGTVCTALSWTCLDCLDMSGYVWICLDMSGYVCGYV